MFFIFRFYKNLKFGKAGFLFPTQFWTAELNENIQQLQNEPYLIRKNNKKGVLTKLFWFSIISIRKIRDLNKLLGTNQLLKQFKHLFQKTSYFTKS